MSYSEEHLTQKLTKDKDDLPQPIQWLELEEELWEIPFRNLETPEMIPHLDYEGMSSSVVNFSLINNINISQDVLISIETKSSDHSANKHSSESSIPQTKRYKPIGKLHEDLYLDQTWLRKPIFNPFFKWTTLITSSILLLALLFPRKIPSLPDNASFPQPVLKPSTDLAQNQLDPQNLAEVKVETSKVDPSTNPHTSSKTKNQAKLANPTHPSNPQATTPNQKQKLQSDPNQPIPNLNEAVVVDRYYIPQKPNDQKNHQNSMMIVDRYYLNPDQKLPSILQNLPIPLTSFYPKPEASTSVQTSQPIPVPPPPVEMEHSAIPTFNSSPHSETNLIANSINPQNNPQNIYTLKGVMSFNDNSAALFQIGNTVLKFYQGEQITPNGWILQELDNGQAILSRNGQTLFLRVGEDFFLPSE